MSQRLLLMEPTSLQGRLLAQVANLLGLQLDVVLPNDFFTHAAASREPFFLVVCDSGTGMHAAEMLEKIHSTPPYAAAVLASEPSVQEAVRAARAGAIRVFDLSYSPQAIAEVIREGLQIESAQRLIRLRRSEMLSIVQQITEGEQGVLYGILRGHANKTIAKNLGVSQRTVESRRQKLFQRFRARSLAELVYLVTTHLRLITSDTDFVDASSECVDAETEDIV